MATATATWPAGKRSTRSTSQSAATPPTPGKPPVVLTAPELVCSEAGILFQFQVIRCWGCPAQLPWELRTPVQKSKGISVPRNTFTVFFYPCGNNCPGGLRFPIRNPREFRFPATHPQDYYFAVELLSVKTLCRGNTAGNLKLPRKLPVTKRCYGLRTGNGACPWEFHCIIFSLWMCCGESKSPWNPPGNINSRGLLPATAR